MIFDGDCNFCALWVHRWRQTTRDAVDFLPSQDPQIAARFPELPPEALETAVHLVETDGSVCSGAEAAFRALAYNPHEHWLLDLYAGSPGLARIAEWGYRFVVGHRRLFSALTRLGWGGHVEPPA
jgi:predicted DCC family thiol-disulfide oxidoreductase YuxK